MLSLGCFIDAVIVEPTPPVIDDVAALTRHRLGGLWVALERHADGIDRRGHLPLGEDAHETPEADTTAVFVGRLHIKIAPTLEWGRHEKVGQARFRNCRITPILKSRFACNAPFHKKLEIIDRRSFLHLSVRRCG